MSARTSRRRRGADETVSYASTKRLAAAAAALATLTTVGCALGGRQADANRIINAAKAAERAGTMRGTLDVRIARVRTNKPAPPGAALITELTLAPVPMQADTKAGRAAVGGGAGAAGLVFDGSVVWQHRVGAQPAPPPTAAADGLAALAGRSALLGGAAPPDPSGVAARGSGPPAPSNLPGLDAAAAAAPLAGKSAARPWVKLDYNRLPRASDEKVAGSLAISPVLLVRMLRGTLAGSVRLADTAPDGTRHYRLRFSRDKAERGLDNRMRIEIEKTFIAHAAGSDIAQGEAWVARDGSLVGATIRLRQELSSATKADLSAHLAITERGTPVQIDIPEKRAVSVVPTLGALVRAVVPAS